MFFPTLIRIGRSDVFGQDNGNFLHTGLHILPHPHDPLSLQDSTVSHERTSTHPHSFFPSGPSSMNLAASSSTSPSSGLHYRPRSPASSAGSKRKTTASPELDFDSEEAQVAIKRHRNTMAARKYRQKRLDRITDLEKALGDMAGERDELKLQLARREAEVEALREMLARK